MTTSARYAEIDSPQAVADTFVELTWNTHEVTIRFDGTMIQYPATVASVDRALGRCVLDITVTADIEQMLKTQQSFVLYARQHSASLQSSAMQVISVSHRSARLSLRCALPDNLTLLKRRGQFRAALKDDMPVAVALSGPTGETWQTTLRDLSAGGCLLSLPTSTAESLEVGKAEYRIRARFPNDETFEVAGQISHRYDDSQSELCYIGVAFDIRLERSAREVWRYVREVEREVARQSAPRSEMRPLAPSRLFEGSQNPDG